MCTAAADALHQATAAMLERRERLAVRVIAGAPRLRAQRAGIEELASEALLFHQPVAGDLRAVVAAIRSAGDLDRMGNLALLVAKAVQRRHPGHTLPAEVRDDFTDMGQVAVQLALKAADVVRSRNVLRAVELDSDDDAMDALHRHMFGVLMDPAWPHGVTAAVDVTLLARYYERFADHAVAVARETVYAVTGRDPDAIPIQRHPGSSTRHSAPSDSGRAR
ncbi:MAG: phosphate signaling complex protein PhoU [Pseudonocardia sp.]|nr:phosphate signaling complex protein PhoU [Pseudonocardia sp.]